MYKRFFRRLSFLLTAAVLLSLLPVLFVSAEEPVSYPAYEEAEDGELLYRVDFRGTDGIYAPKSINTDNTGHKVNTASEDGGSLTLQGNNFYGGPVKGLPLNWDVTYTITYDVELTTNTAQGLGIDMMSATRCRSNFYGNHYNICYMYGGGKATGYDYRSFGGIGFDIKNAGYAAGKPHSYKIVMDGPSKTFSFYVMLTDGTYGLVETAALDELRSDELHLVFRTYQANEAAYADVVFSNVCVYKGFVDTIAVPETEKGSLLLDLGDLSQPATGAFGTTYTPGIDDQHDDRDTDMVYTYDPETNTTTVAVPAEPAEGESNTTVLFGGTTNLRLGYGQQYTITYLSRFGEGTKGGTGIRYSAPNDYLPTQGVYLNATDVCIAKGTLTAANGCYPYVEYTQTTDPDGWNRVAIELNGNQVTVFVNDVQVISYSTLDLTRHVPSKNISGGFATDYLTVAMQDFINGLVPNQVKSQYKDIKVYSGLVVSNDYITVNDGSKTETVAFEKGTDYVLPTWTRSGYVFRGWMLNGNADELLPAGGTVPSATGRNTVEAVFEQNQASLWAQFRDNGDGTQDMRVVGLIDSLNVQEIGYKMVIRYTENGAAKTITEERLALHYAYRSLTAKYGDEVVTAESLGYEQPAYLTAFTIRNLPVDAGTITVELTPYHMGQTDTEPIYEEALTTVITLTNGELS